MQSDFFSVSADSFWISYRKSAILRLHVTLCRWCRIALWDSFGDAIPFLVIATLYGKLGPNSSPKIFPLYSSSLMGNLRGDRWKKKTHLSDKNVSSTILWSLRSSLRHLPEKPVFLKAGFHMIVMTVQFAGLFSAILANIWTLDVHYTTIFLLDWSTESPKIQIN